MNNEELLIAISEMIDEKLDKKLDEKLDKRFDVFVKRMDEKLNDMEQRFDEKLDAMDKRLEYIEFKQDHTINRLNNLQLDIQIKERDIRKDIRRINDTLETVVEVLRSHELIPR